MRRVAHDKATVLLQKIPAGVLLVDNDLKISDMNRCCANLLGEDVVMVYEASPGLQGVELDKICSFTDLFRTVLNTGKEITERQIREGDKIWLLSIYNIQPTAWYSESYRIFGNLMSVKNGCWKKPRKWYANIWLQYRKWLAC